MLPQVGKDQELPSVTGKPACSVHAVAKQPPRLPEKPGASDAKTTLTLMPCGPGLPLAPGMPGGPARPRAPVIPAMPSGPGAPCGADSETSVSFL